MGKIKKVKLTENQNVSDLAAEDVIANKTIKKEPKDISVGKAKVNKTKNLDDLGQQNNSQKTSKKLIKLEQTIIEAKDTKKLKKQEINADNDTIQSIKLEKKKKNAKKQTANVNENDTDEKLNKKDLAKIKKKEAKKLKQKLKKQKVKELLKAQVKIEKDKIEKKLKPASLDKSETDPTMLEKKAALIAKRAKLQEQRPQGAEAQAATIFVGNVPTNTKRVQLIRLFEKVGCVLSVRLRSAGGKLLFKTKQRKEAGTLNAYLMFKNAEVAKAALALNGTEFKGNQLRVTQSEKFTINNVSEQDAKRTVFVGNLKFSANEEKLRDIFSSCGEIDYVRCLRNGSKECKGVAYVCFKSAEAVGLALELNETMLDERPIHVQRYGINKLGAKKQRDEAQKTTQDATHKKKKPNKGKKDQIGNEKNAKPESANDANKKHDFHGVKSNGIKKSKDKKKKSNNQMQQLAKKIAPKSA